MVTTVTCVRVSMCTLVQGDGLEFKKLFKKIKDSVSDLICKPPSLL